MPVFEDFLKIFQKVVFFFPFGSYKETGSVQIPKFMSHRRGNYEKSRKLVVGAADGMQHSAVRGDLRHRGILPEDVLRF